jgi:hypothetical protein
MMALVYHGPGKRSWEDVVVQVAGRVLGHEAVDTSSDPVAWGALEVAVWRS